MRLNTHLYNKVIQLNPHNLGHHNPLHLSFRLLCQGLRYAIVPLSHMAYHVGYEPMISFFTASVNTNHIYVIPQKN